MKTDKFITDVTLDAAAEQYQKTKKEIERLELVIEQQCEYLEDTKNLIADRFYKWYERQKKNVKTDD